MLDEADQMLDLGFIHALKRIVALVPHASARPCSSRRPCRRRSRSCADQYLTNPAEVSVTPTATTVERSRANVTFVNQTEKTALLTICSRSRRRRARAGLHPHQAWRRPGRELLEAAGIRADAIHGNKSQPQRERALAEFKSARSTVLVATDIAARGIDIPGVSHVVNFDLPNVAEQYVHRIGRTARAGADGIAIAFCVPTSAAICATSSVRRASGSRSRRCPKALRWRPRR